MKNNAPKRLRNSKSETCASDGHDWVFFDNFPGHEIFECRSCKLRKFVNLKTGKESYEKGL